MADTYDTFSPNPQQRMMSSGGISFQNPMLDLIFLMLSGGQIAPRPAPNMAQSRFEAMGMRQLTYRQFEAQRTSFANNLLHQKFGGVDPNSAAMSFLSPLLADANGPVAKMLSPFVGGNPMAAQMHILAQMRGQSMHGMGRVDPISSSEADSVMSTLYRNFYTHKMITSNDVKESEDKLKLRAAKYIKGAGLDPAAMEDFSSLIGTEGGTGKFKDKYLKGVNKGKIMSAVDDYKTALSDIATSTPAAEQATAFKKLEATTLKNFDENVVAGIGDPATKKKLSEIFAHIVATGGKEGVDKMTKQLKDNVGGLVTMLEYQDKYKKQLHQVVPIAVDFTKSRGQNIEQIAEGYTSAHRLGLFNQDASPTSSMKDYMERGVPILDVAQSVLGNDKSATQINMALKDMMGVERASFSDDSSKKLLEQLYRINAVSNVHDVDKLDLLSIMQDARGKFSMNPNLRMVGGLSINDMMLKQFSNVAAYSMSLSPDERYKAGGPVGIMGNVVDRTIEDSEMEQKQQLAATYQYFKNTGNEKGMEETANLINDPNAHLSQGNFYRGMSKIARVVGMNQYELLDRTGAANKTLREQGMATAVSDPKIRDGFDSIGSKARWDAWTTSAAITFTSDKAGTSNNKALAFKEAAMSGSAEEAEKVFAKYGIDVSKFIGDEKEQYNQVKQLKGNLSPIQFKQVFAPISPHQARITENLGDKDFMFGKEQYDPNYRKNQAAFKVREEEVVAISKDMDIKYAFTKGGMGSTIAQALMNGAMEEGEYIIDADGKSVLTDKKVGIKGLVSNILNLKSRQFAEARLNQINNLGKETYSGDKKDAIVLEYLQSKEANLATPATVKTLQGLSATVDFDSLYDILKSEDKDASEKIETYISEQKPSKETADNLRNLKSETTRKGAKQVLKTLDPDGALSGKLNFNDVIKRSMWNDIITVQRTELDQRLSRPAGEDFNSFYTPNRSKEEIAKMDELRNRLTAEGVIDKNTGAYSGLTFRNESKEDTGYKEGKGFDDYIDKLAKDESPAGRAVWNHVDKIQAGVEKRLNDSPANIAIETLKSQDKLNTTLEKLEGYAQLFGPKVQEVVTELGKLTGAVTAATAP